jgi:hypothetical protein
MAHWHYNTLLHCMQLLGADGIAVGQYHRIGKGPHCAADIRDQNGNWSTYIVDSAAEAKAKILEITGCEVQQEEDMATRKRSNSYQGDGDTLSNDPSAEGVTVEEMGESPLKIGTTDYAVDLPTGSLKIGNTSEYVTSLPATTPKRTRKPRGTGKPRARKPKNANGLGAQADAYLKRYTELKQHVTAAEAALQAHADSVDESVIRAARVLKELQNEEVES